MSKAIGIDLGTTYSVAAIIEDGRARVVPNAEGENLTPSVFARTARGHNLVGSVAKRQAAANPENTIVSIKRHMGTDYKVSLNGRTYFPQEISSFILRKIKSDVENYLGEKVEKAVITVPAYFNNRQRQATKDAGRMAGLDVIRIINEPTAASLAYGLDREDIQTILVWDLGGGTFDVSILELGDGFFLVKAVSGNTRLGGDDWDQRLLDYFAEKFLNEHGVDIRSDKYALQRLKEASEKAKRALSCQPGVKISLPFIKPACPPARWSEADRARAGRTQNGKLKDPEVSIDRKTFEAITSDLREKLVGPTRLALSDARLAPDEIDRIVLVGGSTRMPSVRELVEKIFNKKPYVKINPDEVVGIGAAVQAGVLTGEISDVVLVDVTPLSLGIETQGGLFTKIIHRNAAIPTSAGQIFTNAEDNQAVMDIHVLQGERETAVDNFSLGQFQLTDIPTLPRGKAQVEVSFKIDVNGIVNVSAQELYTEKQTGIKIDASYLLSDEQVKQAVSEAEAHAQEDMKKREALEINIRADSMIRAAELVVEEKKGKLSTAYLRQIESVILKVKEALAQGESSLIKSKTEALRKLLEKM
ncbi:MAG: molecular chaperone DnaK [Deltaproteobacteria bacterium]|nr:molecular chaperone DnaK [Deltaproteobacteria bacterium]